MPEFALAGSLAVLALAGFAQGIFGIGFAMIATPMLALFLDYRVALIMAAVPMLLMASSWLLANRRHLNISRLPPSLLPAVVAGAIVGVTLQLGLPERVSILMLAGLLAISVASSWALSRWRVPEVSSRTRAGALFGGLAGVTETALNVGAPFLVIYGAFARLTRLEQLVSLNLCFALGKVFQVGLMFLTSAPVVGVTALGLGTIVASAAYCIGDRVASRFSEAGFRRLLQAFLSAMVVALILRAALI